MQVFGLPGHAIRNGKAASRLIDAKPADIEAAIRRDAVERWRSAMAKGLSAEDAAKAVWHIPAERMKMRRPHDVPLSRQALAVLADVWPLSDNGGLVFPSIRSTRRPLSDNSFNAALRRMGYTKDEVTAHGFRVTASTILNSRGFDPDVIEAVLAHQDSYAIRRAYNRASYWDRRMVLMQQWADLLDEFRQYR